MEGQACSRVEAPLADNETSVRDLFRAWNDRDYDSIAGSVAPDCTLTEEGRAYLDTGAIMSRLGLTGQLQG